MPLSSDSTSTVRLALPHLSGHIRALLWSLPCPDGQWSELCFLGSLAEQGGSWGFRCHMPWRLKVTWNCYVGLLPPEPP